MPVQNYERDLLPSTIENESTSTYSSVREPMRKRMDALNRVFPLFTLDELVRQVWPRLEQTCTAGGKSREVSRGTLSPYGD
jgi:hypothetical protein